MPASDADSFEVSAIRPDPGDYAHLSHEHSADFEVTGELTNSDDYPLPQAWAAALHEAGFDGIRYTPRFSPEHPEHPEHPDTRSPGSSR